MSRRAAVLAVGDELLAGAHPDLNSPEIARQLAPLGMSVVEVRLVHDLRESIAAAAKALATRADVVFVTGGLGPTLDDVTREGIADAAGVELEVSAEALADLAKWFEGRGIPMVDANRRQALFPVGSTMIHNTVGTAPGFRIDVGDAVVVSLPGPPRELRHVLSEEVVPWLVDSGRAQAALDEHSFFLFDLPESVFADRAGDWMGRAARPRMGCSAKGGVLSVVLRAQADDPIDPTGEAARVQLASRVHAFRERFGEHVFSESEGRLEHVLVARLRELGARIATAESCTGGGVANLITSVPGASSVFGRGLVTYDADAKAELVGVERELIRRHGVVSEEVAEAMAVGAAEATGAELTLAVTGVAGPDSDERGTPIGLVWFATSFRGQVLSTSRHYPAYERGWIRAIAARKALHLGWQRLAASPGPGA